MFEILSVYLENGLRVIVHKTTKTGIASCGLWINQGSKHEEDQYAGISHYLEHLLVDKYNSRNPRLLKMFEDITNNGILYNALTTKEDTNFFLKGLSTHVPLMIQSLYTIVVNNDTFSEESIQREKKLLKEKLLLITPPCKSFRDKIKALEIHKRTGRTINIIADIINPIVRGWPNYFGMFNPSAMKHSLDCVDRRLIKWAMCKYKRFRGRRRRAEKWLSEVKSREPELFAYWKLQYVR